MDASSSESVLLLPKSISAICEGLVGWVFVWEFTWGIDFILRSTGAGLVGLLSTMGGCCNSEAHSAETGSPSSASPTNYQLTMKGTAYQVGIASPFDILLPRRDRGRIHRECHPPWLLVTGSSMA